MRIWVRSGAEMVYCGQTTNAAPQFCLLGSDFQGPATKTSDTTGNAVLYGQWTVVRDSGITGKPVDLASRTQAPNDFDPFFD